MTNLQKDWPSLSCPISNGFRFWSHEWEKHGACSESQLDQHEYFEAALNLKKKVNPLQILRIARIEPNDGLYSLDNIIKAIIKGIGHTPRIGCNKDSDGNSQLYQIYLCVDSSGAEIIEYPVPPKGRCASIKYHDTDKRLVYITIRINIDQLLHYLSCLFNLFFPP